MGRLQKAGEKAKRAAFFGALLPFIGAGFISPALAQAKPAAPPAAPASARNVPLAILPFSLEDNLVVLEMALVQTGQGEKYRVPAGTSPLRLILDTGADFTVLTEEAFAERGLSLPQPAENETPIQMHGFGGSLSMRSVPGIEMQAGGLLLSGNPRVASFKALHEYGIDGVLGAELFLNFVVEVDYSKKTLRVFTSKNFAPPAPDSGFRAVPIRLSGVHKRPVVFVKVQPYTFGPASANLVIDTGLQATASFSPDFVRRNKWYPVAPKTVERLIQGVGGIHRENLGRLKQLNIGGFMFTAPPVGFSTVAKSREASRDDSDGNLGAEILSRFAIIFDYSRSVMYLRPNATANAPFTYRYFGVEIDEDPDPPVSGLPVYSIDPTGPVARAGIRVGEVIVAVDNKSVAKMTRDQFIALLTNGKSGERIFTVGDAKGQKKRAVRVAPVAL